MKTIIDHSANTIVLLLGLFHTVMTLMYRRPFDLDALMYVGAGLAFIFVVLFNFARLQSREILVKRLSLLCNLITLIYVFAIAFEFADMRAFIVIIALVILLVSAAMDVVNANKNSR